MKRQNKNILIATLLSTGLVAGGFFGGSKIHQNAVRKEKARQERELRIDQLKSDNERLNGEKEHYGERLAFYSSSVTKNAKGNPNHDNMDKLYVLTEKMDSVVSKNFFVLEKRFNDKCKAAVARFANRKGQYHISGDGGGEYIVPSDMHEWMEIVYENSESIPNFDALELEYNRLSSIEYTMWDFESFMGSTFDIYISKGEQRQHFKQAKVFVHEKESEHIGNGLTLDGTVYSYIEDDVRELNDMDNVEQNKIIKELLQEYLYKFIVSGENGMPLMDNDLFNEIHHLALGILEHNSLEAGKNSYDYELREVSRQIAQNQQKIAELQQKNR